MKKIRDKLLGALLLAVTWPIAAAIFYFFLTVNFGYMGEFSTWAIVASVLGFIIGIVKFGEDE